MLALVVQAACCAAGRSWHHHDGQYPAQPVCTGPFPTAHVLWQPGNVCTHHVYAVKRQGVASLSLWWKSHPDRILRCTACLPASARPVSPPLGPAVVCWLSHRVEALWGWIQASLSLLLGSAEWRESARRGPRRWLCWSSFCVSWCKVQLQDQAPPRRSGKPLPSATATASALPLPGACTGCCKRWQVKSQLSHGGLFIFKRIAIAVTNIDPRAQAIPCHRRRTLPRARLSVTGAARAKARAHSLLQAPHCTRPRQRPSPGQLLLQS